MTDLDTNRAYHSIPRWLGSSRVLKFKVWLESHYASKDDDMRVLAYASALNQQRGQSWQQRFGTKNTSFIEAVLHHGATYRQDDIRSVQQRSITLTSGDVVPCDAIVVCTGFAIDFPFLSSSHSELVTSARCARRMFKHVFVPEWGDKIAFCGFIRPGIGSIPPAAEMQARYTALVLAGKLALPRVDDMRAIIEHDVAMDLAQYPNDAPRLSALTGLMQVDVFVITLHHLVVRLPHLHE